jgi:myosin heavy subunit
MTLLSARMSDYPTITHGKTRIPGINDGEEFEETNVSLERREKIS